MKTEASWSIDDSIKQEKLINVDSQIQFKKANDLIEYIKVVQPNQIVGMVDNGILSLQKDEKAAFFDKFLFLDFGENISREIFCEVLDVFVKDIYTNSMGMVELGNTFATDDLIMWERTSDYMQFIIEKMNFENQENFFQTYAYLNFVDILNTYSEFSSKQRTEWPKTSKQVYDKIAKGSNNKNSSYFLYLYAKDVENKRRTESLRPIYQWDEEDEKFEKNLKDKYGDEWEEYIDYEMDEIENKKNIYLCEVEPFLVAPQIYAVVTDDGFLLSEQRDYEEVTKLMEEINSLPNTNNDFYEYYPQEDLSRENIARKIMFQFWDKEDKLLGFFKDNLKKGNVFRTTKNKIEESDFKEYKALQASGVRECIQREAYFNLADLNLDEQFYFLQFAKNIRMSEVEKLQEFIRSSNKSKGEVNRLRAFLSLEQGGSDMGAKILMIGEKLEVEEADLIFERYAKLVNLTKDVRHELKKRFKSEEVESESNKGNNGRDETEKKGVSDDEVQNISDIILKKASSLLISFADRLEKNEKLNNNEILRELEYFNDDLLFTFSVFKEVESVGLEDLKDVNLERVSAERYVDVKEEILAIGRCEYNLENLPKIKTQENERKNGFIIEVYEMFELYKKNYTGREKFQKELLEEFAQALTDGRKTSIYIVKKDNQVVAFNKYDKISENQKYFGSCNVMSSMQALAIGGAIFKKSIEQEAPNYNIEATADAFSPVSSLYIERGNFQVERIDTESDPNGIPWFILKRVEDKKRNNYFEDKKLSKEYDKQDKDFEILKKLPHFVVKFDNLREQEKLIITLVNDEKFKITRSFFDKNSKVTYVGFEKKKL